jgi:hypothetical protein
MRAERFVVGLVVLCAACEGPAPEVAAERQRGPATADVRGYRYALEPYFVNMPKQGKYEVTYTVTTDRRFPGGEWRGEENVITKRFTIDVPAQRNGPVALGRDRQPRP